jgi:transposase-like protein
MVDDELITRGERRRRRSVEQKREIAAESLEPGVSSITVARRYGISSGLLYTWRRHLLEGSLGSGPLCYAGVFVYKGPPHDSSKNAR